MIARRRIERPRSRSIKRARVAPSTGEAGWSLPLNAASRLVHADLSALGRRCTLAAWCDRTLGTQITEQINREMIKWCEAFLDEEHAAWSMPGGRKASTPHGTLWLHRNGRPAALPESPENCSPAGPSGGRTARTPCDAGHPVQLGDYLALHFAAMPGWAGFIKWRADQTDYEWQQVYPIDLVQYLAARLWYERELVQQVCRGELGIDGTVQAIRGVAASKDSPKANRTSPHNRSASWRLVALASALEIPPRC
jgi:hypothetical protein